MLTVKNIRPDNSVYICQTESVAFWPSCHEPDAGRSQEQDKVTFLPEGENVYMELRTGSIYVMNDNGATVDKYHLGDGSYSPQPENGKRSLYDQPFDDYKREVSGL